MRYPARISKVHLLKVSYPIFFSNLTIPLVGLIDTFLMGNLGNVKYLVATSIATTVMTTILWSFGFLRMGTVGLVAQSYGRADYREIILILQRNVFLALIISIILILLKSSIVDLTSYFFNISDETQELIEKYFSVRFYSIPAELLIYVFIGFFLGLQRTFITSFLVSSFCIINILFSIYFVKYLNLNIYGVALGTLISAYLVTIIASVGIYFYISKNFKILPRFKKTFQLNKLIKLITINFYIFLRTLLLTFSFLWFTYLSSKLGENFLAVNAILLQFLAMSSFLLDAYAFSTEGIIGYSIGNRNLKMFSTTVKNSIELSFFTGILISLFYLLFFKEIVNYLTDSDIIRYITYSFLFWIILLPPVSSIAYQLDGIFIGASQSQVIRNGMIISSLLYIFLSFNLTKIFENNGLWLSMVLFMIFRSLTLRLFFYKIVKKF